MCFVGIRLVSLHQIDGLLERRHVAGVRVGAVLEVVGVSLVIVSACLSTRFVAARDPSSVAARR